MEKITSMQALLVDNNWENCGHFWVNNKFLLVDTHQIHKSSLQQTLNLFLLENIPKIEENCKFGHFCLLRNYSIMWIFCSPENVLVDKSIFFPCSLVLPALCKFCWGSSLMILPIKFLTYLKKRTFFYS